MACVGRESVQARIDAALGAARWVTLVGPPGSGKTLLARHVAASRPATVWVDAVRLRRVDEVTRACLTALESEPEPGETPERALARTLDRLENLVVVDGVGSDIDGLGAMFQEVVDATTRGRLAITALTAAGQPAEQVIRVGPLPVPGPRDRLAGPSVDLLRSRVAAAGGHPIDLEADEADLRRLLGATGGLPLLIEHMAVQIALVGVPNVVPTASLAEAVHGSYELLPPEQKLAFRRLAQMTAPVSLEVLAEITEIGRLEAAAVAGGLARHSLLEVQPDGRFDLLAPIRRQGILLAASTDDGVRARQGILRWAERVAPSERNTGAADAPWLADLPIMRAAISAACADPLTRAQGYSLANRIFSGLYTAMRAIDAVEILEGVLMSGDGPPDIGAQVARRAGIAASETRGTYEGLWLLDRAEEHALSAPRPAVESARNASIRAEMHLDAGDLLLAEEEAGRALSQGADDPVVVRQARRTLADVFESRGDFDAARAMAELVMDRPPADERWLVLSTRLILGHISLEQGRLSEARATARSVLVEARALAEDRIGLLAETLLRQVDPDTTVTDVDRENLPWAVRLGILIEDARKLGLRGDTDHATGLAADIVVMADSARLGRDGVGARLLLGHALLVGGQTDEAEATFLAALDRAVRCPLPLRAADALDGLAHVARRRQPFAARTFAATARQLRVPRFAVAWGGAARHRVDPGGAVCPSGWVVDGQLTRQAVDEVAGSFVIDERATTSPIDLLTRSERAVAVRVAAGLTSRQIAEELFVSPRTVDAHLSHIYRKLDIPSRARLASLMANHA